MNKLLNYIFQNILPKFVNETIFKKFFAKIPEDYVQGLIFEIAKSRIDLESAFSLLHDSLVAKGNILEQESGLYLTIYHALPSSSVLVAKLNGMVVGAVSVIPDSPLGLPMENFYNFSPVKKQYKLTEISYLAIHKNVQAKLAEALAFYLVVYAGIYSIDCMDSSFINSEEIDEAFNVKKIGKMGFHYSLNEILLKKKHTCLKSLKHKAEFVKTQAMSPRNLYYFFQYKTNIFEKLTSFEKLTLNQFYPGSNYSNFAFKDNPSEFSNKAKFRKKTHLEGICLMKNSNRLVKILLHDIAFRGFKAFVDSPIDEKAEHCFMIELPGKKMIQVSASMVWSSPSGVCGFVIFGHNEDWMSLCGNEFVSVMEMVS